ncbi:hypothetical protein ACWERI_31650 [Streptomyces collinus]
MSTRVVDFATLLRSRPVKDALIKLMLKPDSEILRADVMRELCAERAYLLRKTPIDPGRVERTPAGRPRSAAQPPGDYVLVRDCEGVQAGGRCVQHNEFLYPCHGSRINERELVAARPELAEAIVDMITDYSPASTPPTVWGAIDSALNGIPDPARFGRVVHDFRRTCVEGADGVSYGRDNEATYTREVTSSMRRNRVEALLNHEKDRLKRAANRQAIQQADRAEQTAKRQTRDEPASAAPTTTPSVPDPRLIRDPDVTPNSPASRSRLRTTSRPTRLVPDQLFDRAERDITHSSRDAHPRYDRPHHPDPPDRSGPSLPGF